MNVFWYIHERHMVSWLVETGQSLMVVTAETVDWAHTPLPKAPSCIWCLFLVSQRNFDISTPPITQCTMPQIVCTLPAVIFWKQHICNLKRFHCFFSAFIPPRFRGDAFSISPGSCAAGTNSSCDCTAVTGSSIWQPHTASQQPQRWCQQASRCGRQHSSPGQAGWNQAGSNIMWVVVKLLSFLNLTQPCYIKLC